LAEPSIVDNQNLARTFNVEFLETDILAQNSNRKAERHQGVTALGEIEVQLSVDL
jgi:hypothetical protein